LSQNLNISNKDFIIPHLIPAGRMTNFAPLNHFLRKIRGQLIGHFIFRKKPIDFLQKRQLRNLNEQRF